MWVICLFTPAPGLVSLVLPTWGGGEGGRVRKGGVPERGGGTGAAPRVQPRLPVTANSHLPPPSGFLLLPPSRGRLKIATGLERVAFVAAQERGSECWAVERGGGNVGRRLSILHRLCVKRCYWKSVCQAQVPVMGQGIAFL